VIKLNLGSELTGMVLRIEKTSIHDGDGLRTVVFMKGCPLKCWWCSTPESQNMEIQEYKNKKGELKRYGELMSVNELVKQISKDEIFYFHSGGGVTFSGGEPLLQSSFVAEVMKRCKRMGINTALETTLITSYDDIEKVLPWLDALYVDIKHLSNEEHKRYTNVDNTLILENILKVDSSDHLVDIYIRIPVIPSVNDTNENLLSTIEFCNKLNKIKEIELLPYHRLGIGTYKNLGIEYRLPNVSPPKPERMLELVKFMSENSKSIHIRTGGGFLKD